MGDSYDHLGKDNGGSCQARFIVAGFKRGSYKITRAIEKDIKDIAKKIVGLLEPTLRPLKVKKNFILRLHFEGHVDKTTDPKQGKLDDERAGMVGAMLSRLIVDRWNAARFGGFQIENTYSAAGASRPTRGASSKNRRVEVCIKSWTFKKR